jgi:hypothetical protein
MNEVRHHRGMANTDHCQLCGAVDTWQHGLLDSSMARSVWTLVDEGVVEHMSTAHERDARAWIANMIATLNVTMFVALWVIWHARRKAIHENIFQSPLSAHYFVQI